MYDAIVVGGGHAGSEAALALARLHQRTLLVTGRIARIATMPCNPSIGGPAKGTIVREIDALGGEMGKIADLTSLQMKMLNASKGPAVRALRAQSDKVAYPLAMQEVLLSTPLLTVEEAYVVRLIVVDRHVAGVVLEDGSERRAAVVVITAGTYMEGSVLVGATATPSGPDGERPSVGLSAHLRELGIETFRLKTGTPPRIRRDSIDFTKMEVSPGDAFRYRFSFTASPFVHPATEWPCYLIHTTEETRSVITANLRKSAMYSGLVKGVGPRYCPSIEDKFVRFADKERHQLFIEPESASLDVVYLQGFSTSMPQDVQERMVRSLPGLEKAVIARYAYAIEYDAVRATDLWPTLESKLVGGLYFAGQVNGTSGYEEAAAQGLLAGINAAHALAGKPPFILRRDEAYIGVLIDDLVTKGVLDPYRMLTSRAEFRLLLRHDNADLRLTPHGRRLGLIDDAQWLRFERKREAIAAETARLQRTTVAPTPAVNAALAVSGSGELREKQTLYELLKRPELGYADVVRIAGEEPRVGIDEGEQIAIEATYEGYIRKAAKEAEKLRKEENIRIPPDFDYDIHNLAQEARVKLRAIRPLSLGQASRISGVNPADVQAIAFRLKSKS